MDYNEIARKIIEYSGGKENIINGLHCITRVRLYLKDEKKANVERMKKVDGVVGAQFQNGQFQIILGPHVDNVFEILDKELHFHDISDASKYKKKGKILDAIIDTISQIFTPVVPAVVGAGVMKGIMALLLYFKILTDTSGTYAVLNMISDAAFYFLPFLLAVSASRKFKLNEFLGLSLAGILLYPTLINATEPIKFLGVFKIPIVTYSTSVIPIILGVWLMSYVYRLIDKFIPKALRLVLTPLLSMMITTPVLLIILGPLGSYAGNYVAIASTYLFTRWPLAAGLIVGAVYPLIIMTGMHYAYFPVLFQNISKYGYDNGFFPIGLFSNLAQAGAAFAVALKTKNKSFKSVAISSGIAATLGTTEPALYGINLKLKKPLIASMISGGIVSAAALTIGIKYYGFVAPGLIALSVCVSPDGTMANLMVAVIGVAASFILAFILTMILGFEDVQETQKDTEAEKIKKEASFKGAVLEEASMNTKISITSPLKGRVVSLKEVPDATFAEEKMGKGIAVLPEEGRICAPFDGKVAALVESKHAIGLVSNEGTELLIHIGMDTVNLKGRYFEAFVKQGQEVAKGDLLIQFDKKAIEEEKYSLVTPIIVTNTWDYLDVLASNKNRTVQAGDELLTILK
ncbi:PTS system, beta-glucosides-specific IIC component [Anaerocolumna jejuensis DSM 15929]|uniref:PTS system, beta-glucosides-specific IIC component n=1 Tax=Anaerocolumna jejuensis DSM 15929 TaxID=1121322 RepID=A0A1M6NU64_9FIRM|nr:beta-glucoside-specific PTS transporter subunit IIABC [Anaerocolumna jejuensis]SHJ99253.1 PTS system, beta-glucosides-specific IIC component [Anaerocolumna jejuensis DSM 15929]